MAKGTPVKEYIIKITPQLDTEKYNNVMSNLQKRINNTFKNKEPKGDDLKTAAKTLNGVKSSTSAISKVIGSVPGKIGLIVAAAKTLYDMMKKITDKATEFSNKMISMNSAFVDKNTRDIVSRFGVSSQTATGMGSVMNLMGIDVDDMKRMTGGQMTLFSNLMNQWTEGMNSIDPKKMQKFQDVMQGFQSEFASAKLELQIQLYQMLVDLAPSLGRLFKSVISFFKSVSDMLTSDLMQNLLTALSEILAFIVNVFTLVYDLMTGNWGKLKEDIDNLSGGSTSTSNTVYNVTSTSYNGFYGDNNTMFDLATNLDSQRNQTISNAELKSGRI